jgi:hypothetical protein
MMSSSSRPQTEKPRDCFSIFQAISDHTSDFDLVLCNPRNGNGLVLQPWIPKAIEVTSRRWLNDATGNMIETHEHAGEFRER